MRLLRGEPLFQRPAVTVDQLDACPHFSKIRDSIISAERTPHRSEGAEGVVRCLLLLRGNAANNRPVASKTVQLIWVLARCIRGDCFG